MDGVVLPPCLFFGLRWSSPWAYRLYGQVNGDLQEGLCQGRPSRTAAACASIPLVSPCQSMPPMAPHSSALAWKIPWMEELGGLESMGSQTVRHNWVIFTFKYYNNDDDMIVQLMVQIENDQIEFMNICMFKSMWVGSHIPFIIFTR